MWLNKKLQKDVTYVHRKKRVGLKKKPTQIQIVAFIVISSWQNTRGQVYVCLPPAPFLLHKWRQARQWCRNSGQTERLA